MAIAAAGAFKAYGALCKGLPAKWHLLRNCTLNVDGELHFVQLIILHRDYGVGLVDFRHEAYTFPELAIRLTRSILETHGLAERFPGFLPIVFIATTPTDGRKLPARIAAAFSAEAKVAIGRADWADWAFKTLQCHAEEGRPGASADDNDTDDDAPEVDPFAPDPVPRRFFGRLAVGLAAFVFAASTWLVTATLTAIPAAKDFSPSAQDDVRLLNETAVAKYLGLDLATFRKHRDALRKDGFPNPINVTGGYDKQAIDRWIGTASRP